jgi:hypothetical protein
VDKVSFPFHSFRSIDRYGVMRPTKNVKFSQDEPSKDIEKWKTVEKWLHWDLNPWKVSKKSSPSFDENNFNFLSENNDNYMEPFKVQGLIALLDSREEDGGFLCVPGFHTYLEEWAQENIEIAAPERSNFVSVPKKDEIQSFARRIPMRSGSLIIWNSNLPHCNYPNNSENFRMNQYIKMFKSYKDAPKGYLEMRKNLLLKNLPKVVELNDFKNKILFD